MRLCNLGNNICLLTSSHVEMFCFFVCRMLLDYILDVLSIMIYDPRFYLSSKANVLSLSLSVCVCVCMSVANWPDYVQAQIPTCILGTVVPMSVQFSECFMWFTVHSGTRVVVSTSYCSVLKACGKAVEGNTMHAELRSEPRSSYTTWWDCLLVIPPYPSVTNIFQSSDSP